MSVVKPRLSSTLGLIEGDTLLDVDTKKTHKVVKVLDDKKVALEGTWGNYDVTQFRFQPPDLLHRFDVPWAHPKVGDYVVVIDSGWGIDSADGIELMKPYKVVGLKDAKRWRFNPGGVPRIVLEGFPGASVVAKACRVVRPKNLSVEPSDSISEQINIATKLLKKLQQQPDIKDVVLAGGAPRNWDHGKPARDLDIYVLPLKVSSVSAKMRHALRRITEQTSHTTSPKPLGVNSHLYLHNTIKSVYALKYQGMPVEVIVLDPYKVKTSEFPQVLMDIFNCNLCKITYTPLDGLCRTPDYKTDKMNKTLTYPFYKYEADYHRERSLERHIPKMMKYFPKHTVVIQQAPEGDLE